MKAVVTLAVLVAFGCIAYFGYQSFKFEPSEGIVQDEVTTDGLASDDAPAATLTANVNAMFAAASPTTASGVTINPSEHLVATFEMW